MKMCIYLYSDKMVNNMSAIHFQYETKEYIVMGSV